MVITSSFRFERHEDHINEGYVLFNYALTRGGDTRRFAERLTFSAPPADRILQLDGTIIRRLLDNLSIALGVSYWKLTCPPTIQVDEELTLVSEQAQFWDIVYTKALGEFFYKNNIDYRGLIHFPYQKKTLEKSADQQFQDRSLVLSGAGKDSMVSAELLKELRKTFSLYTLNPLPIHEETARIVGRPLIRVQREIDKKLYELNTRTGFYNGHIPITSIFSWIGLFAAYLYDYKNVIVSNEESANYGNVSYLGQEVNHQWSKSLEYENMLRGYLTSFVSPDLEYFSLVRPITEIHIMKLFSTYSQYFSSFSSCNKNFTIHGDHPPTLWCGVCPKCAFVFLLLTVFLPRDIVISIFQKNLFADESLLSVYKELLGLEGFKPFECVGTPQEAISAFRTVIQKKEYESDILVKKLTSPQLMQIINKEDTKSVYKISEHHNIPKTFAEVLRIYETR